MLIYYFYLVYDTLGGLFDNNVPNQNQTDISDSKSNNSSFIGVPEDFTKMPSRNLLEIDKIPENLPEDEIKQRVNIIIDKWSNGVSEKKNLLLLMATLHEVWSKDDKLKEISLKELVDDPAKASREYRKAMLYFHDDKIKRYSVRDQIIAKGLYYILTHAHEEYRGKEKY